MKVVLYQHTEAPLILTHVVRIEEENEGDTIIIHDLVDGRTEFQDSDIEHAEIRPNASE